MAKNTIYDSLPEGESYLKILLTEQKEAREKILNRCGKRIEYINAGFLKNFGFSTKAINVLKKAKIFTLDELIKYPKEKILKITSCGEATYNEIVSKVHELGLFFYSEYFKNDKGIEECIEDLKLEQEEYIKGRVRNADTILLEDVGIAAHICIKFKRFNILTLEDLLRESSNNLCGFLGFEDSEKVKSQIHSMGLKFKDEIEINRTITSSEITAIKTKQQKIFELKESNARKELAIDKYEELSGKLKEEEEKSKLYDHQISFFLNRLVDRRNATEKDLFAITTLSLKLKSLLTMKEGQKKDVLELVDEVIDSFSSSIQSSTTPKKLEKSIK